MDYSFLLVIETSPSTGEQAYHMGIIDYLQKWNFSKKLEHCFKTTIHRGIKDKLSAIPPQPYQKRFISFLRDNVIRKLHSRVLRKEDKVEFIKSLISE